MMPCSVMLGANTEQTESTASPGLAGPDMQGLLLVPKPKRCGRAKDPYCMERQRCQSGGETSGALQVDGKIHCLALHDQQLERHGRR